MTEPDDKPFGVPGTEGASAGGEPEVDEVAVAKAANRFDIRRLIGSLFILYGLILLVLGLVVPRRSLGAGHAERAIWFGHRLSSS